MQKQFNQEQNQTPEWKSTPPEITTETKASSSTLEHPSEIITGKDAPSTPARLDEVVAELQHEAEKRLGCVEPTSFGFSPQAFEAVKVHIALYIDDLLEHSAKEARRSQADLVSKTHVDKSAQHLVTGSEKRAAKHLGSAGYTVLGTGAGALLSLAQTGNFPFLQTIIALILLGIGIAMVAYHIGKD